MGKDCCDIKVEKAKNGLQIKVSGIDADKCIKQLEECLRSCCDADCCK